MSDTEQPSVSAALQALQQKMNADLSEEDLLALQQNLQSMQKTLKQKIKEAQNKRPLKIPLLHTEADESTADVLLAQHLVYSVMLTGDCNRFRKKMLGHTASDAFERYVVYTSWGAILAPDDQKRPTLAVPSWVSNDAPSTKTGKTDSSTWMMTGSSETFVSWLGMYRNNPIQTSRFQHLMTVGFHEADLIKVLRSGTLVVHAEQPLPTLQHFFNRYFLLTPHYMSESKTDVVLSHADALCKWYHDDILDESTDLLYESLKQIWPSLVSLLEFAVSRTLTSSPISDLKKLQIVAAILHDMELEWSLKPSSGKTQEPVLIGCFTTHDQSWLAIQNVLWRKLKYHAEIKTTYKYSGTAFETMFKDPKQKIFQHSDLPAALQAQIEPEQNPIHIFARMIHCEQLSKNAVPFTSIKTEEPQQQKHFFFEGRHATHPGKPCTTKL